MVGAAVSTNAEQPSRYSFSEPSSEWARAFARERERLEALLGSELVVVHHVGSTSVPGLAAKPIIDLVPVVHTVERFDGTLGDVLVKAGYRAWGAYGLPGRRFFTRDREGLRTHNLHAYAEGDPAIDRHRAFAAFLRIHEDLRREYEGLKRGLYRRHPADIEAYNQGKDRWIKRVELDALQWWRSEGRT